MSNLEERVARAIDLALLRWGNSPLLEVALKVKGPPSDTSRLIARTAIEACGIEEARARIAALEETLTESRAWLNASLGLVEGDDGPPNWDGIREHIEEIDAILTPAQQMDRITGENDGLTAALNEAQAERASNSVLRARVAALEDALRGLEPYLDAIVCYAS